MRLRVGAPEDPSYSVEFCSVFRRLLDRPFHGLIGLIVQELS